MIFQRETIGNGNNLNKPNGVSHLHLRALLCLITLLAPLSSTTQAKPFAAQAKRFEDGVAWTKNINVTKKAINVEDYCADNDVSCKTKVHNPDQSGMNSVQVNSKKTSAYFNNKQATAIQDNFDKGRPKIDPNDVTYRMALIGQNNAYEISHGISTAYADCESGMTCTLESALKICKMPTNNPLKCEETASLELDGSTESGQFVKNGWFSLWPHYSVTYDIPKSVTGSSITLKNIYSSVGNQRPSNLYVNGQFVGNIGVGFRTYIFSLAGIDFSDGKVKLSTTGGLMGMYSSPTITVKWKIQKAKAKWTNNCSTVLPSCSQVSRTCIEGAGVRMLGNAS